MIRYWDFSGPELLKTVDAKVPIYSMVSHKVYYFGFDNLFVMLKLITLALIVFVVSVFFF